MQGSTKQIIGGVSLALAGLLAGGGAQARGVYWSVDVDAPVVVGGNVHTEFSNAPRVRYVQPQPVVVAAAPVMIEQPEPVYVERRWCPPRAVYVPAQPVVFDDGRWLHRHGGWRDDDRGWGRGEWSRREWERREHWEHERREHRGHDRD